MCDFSTCKIYLPPTLANTLLTVAERQPTPKSTYSWPDTPCVLRRVPLCYRFLVHNDTRVYSRNRTKRSLCVSQCFPIAFPVLASVLPDVPSCILVGSPYIPHVVLSRCYLYVSLFLANLNPGSTRNPMLAANRVWFSQVSAGSITPCVREFNNSFPVHSLSFFFFSFHHVFRNIRLSVSPIAFSLSHWK